MLPSTDPCHLLDLAAIEASLLAVQARFDSLNGALDEPRDPFVDLVRQNLLEGYALVDKLVREKVDLFDLQQLDWMIEINNLVLCGSDPEQRLEYAKHLSATQEHFYNPAEGGGINALYEWYQAHRDQSVWKRAAGTFVRILSKPQLFIEGNHRSATLIASFLLMQDGRPPFVLSTENATAFFNPASVVKRTSKHGVSALFKLPKIKKRYAEFLKEQSDPQFLQAEAAARLLSRKDKPE